MKVRDLPADLVRRLRASEVEHYVRSQGWSRVDGVPAGIAVYRRPDADDVEVLLPLAKDFIDTADRIGDSIVEIATYEKRPPRELLFELLQPADVLRFRIQDDATVLGGYPFLPMALELLANCRQSLAAAACTVVEPQSFHPRLFRTETEAFLSACRLGTEHGSFVATVLCPLNAASGETSSGPQLAISGPGFEATETFARRVVKTVMRSADRLVRAVDAQALDKVLHGEQRQEDISLSANLCEAIAGMEPQDARGKLEIRCRWSPAIPRPTDAPERVVIKREHFAAFGTVAAALRPSPQEPKESVYVGRVESLHGVPDEEALVGGDIVLSFQADDQRLLKARVLLDHPAYIIACDAHKFGHFVGVAGILKRGPRVGRIEQPTGFRDLSADSGTRRP